MIREHKQACWNSDRAGGSRKLRGMKTYIKTKNYPAIACFCSAAMSSSKMLTETTERHFEVFGCANSCNKFVSTQSWLTMKLLLIMILLWKGIPVPFAPLFKRQGRQYPHHALAPWHPWAQIKRILVLFVGLKKLISNCLTQEGQIWSMCLQ